MGFNSVEVITLLPSLHLNKCSFTSPKKERERKKWQGESDSPNTGNFKSHSSMQTHFKTYMK